MYRTVRGWAATLRYEELGPFPLGDKRSTGQLDFVRPLSAVDADKRYRLLNADWIPVLRESRTGYGHAQENNIFCRELSFTNTWNVERKDWLLASVLLNRYVALLFDQRENESLLSSDSSNFSLVRVDGSKRRRAHLVIRE